MMPLFRRRASQPSTNPSPLDQVPAQLAALSEQLGALQQTLSEMPRLDPASVRQSLSEIIAQLRALHDKFPDDLAQQLVQHAYHLFRSELHVVVDQPPLVAGNDFLYLPLNPNEQYDLLFFHPADPTMLGTRVILNQSYAYTDHLTNTLALHIQVHRAPPGLAESLIQLHAQSGPVLLGYRARDQREASQKVTYWLYSGTSHNQNAHIQGGIYARHLIFYYLLSGGSVHTYAEEIVNDPLASSGMGPLSPEMPVGEESPETKHHEKPPDTE